MLSIFRKGKEEINELEKNIDMLEFELDLMKIIDCNMKKHV